MKKPTVEETIAFIKTAHKGQKDWGGEEYWLHPFAVMERLGDGASDDEKVVALLHDVLEDTAATRDDLLALGYSDEIVSSVERLSRPKGVTYMDWIRSIAVSGDRVAIKVKIADNEHNSCPERNGKLPEDKRDIVKRYERSLRILRAA